MYMVVGKAGVTEGDARDRVGKGDNLLWQPLKGQEEEKEEKEEKRKIRSLRRRREKRKFFPDCETSPVQGQEETQIPGRLVSEKTLLLMSAHIVYI